MQDASSNLDASGQKGKDIIDSFGDALVSNFSVAAVGKVVAQLDTGASLLLKQFGVGQEMAQALRATMADAVSNVRALGGDIKDVYTTQEDAAKALQRNVILAADVNKDLYATSQVTGKGVGELVGKFKDVGYGAGQVAKEMKNVVDIAAQSGVNARDVSSKVLSNMDALNKYNFEGGVSGLAKMAAQASMLRIDMKTTLGFAEKVFDPEGAIEMAAAMQRLGVSQSSLLDPLKMMDLAQNDPGELQNQMAEMGKQFVQLNEKGQFEIMPGAKRQMRELEKAMGLPAGELAKMSLASAELEDKMSKIRFPDLDIDEDKQKMIANMAEMGTGGKYEVQVEDKETGQMITKAIDELTKEDVDYLEKVANTAPKTMEELAKGQLTALESIQADIKSIADKSGLGIARTKTTGKVLDTSRQISTGIQKTLSPKELETKNLAATIDAGIDRNLDILKRLTDGEITKTEAVSEFKESLSKLSTFIDTTFKSSMTKGGEELDKILKDNPILTQIQQVVSGDFRGINQIKKETSDADPMNLKRDINNVRNTSTNQGNTTSTTNAQSDKPIEITLNHNIDLKTNGNVDTNQIVMALKNTDVQQGMVGALKEAMYSNGFNGSNLKQNSVNE
jgi:BMFP domain-containing protein YqiC